jgi:hypothetical protein
VDAAANDVAGACELCQPSDPVEGCPICDIDGSCGKCSVLVVNQRLEGGAGFLLAHLMAELGGLF